MSRYRKAIAAFITPLLALPYAGWASGEVSFEVGLIAGAIVAGLSAALVYIFPNTPEA